MIPALLGLAVLAGCLGWFLYSRKREAASSFDTSVIVTDPAILTEFAHVYAATASRIYAKYPDAVVFPVWMGTLYTHTSPLPKPYSERWGVAFPQHPDGGNRGGSIVLTTEHQGDHDLWAHEAAHLICNTTDHPAWLFGPGLSLSV